MILRAALILVVVAALTGCTSGALPGPSSSPTPVPIAVDPPLPALPLACGEIVAPESLAAFAGETVPVRRDALDTPNHWYDVATRQQQILFCDWSADRDLAPLSLVAIPNAAADFAAYRAGLVPNHYDRLDAVGDQSVHQCGYGQCRFEVLVGDFWVSGFANRLTMMDDADLEPLFVPLIEEIADSVREALPEVRDAWKPPSDVLADWGPGCDGTAPVAEIAAALGSSDALAAGPLENDGGSWGLIRSRIAVSQCHFQDSETLSYLGAVALVEAGGWVADEWSAQPPAQWDSGFYEPVEVDGVGIVYLGDEGSQWDAHVAIEGSLAWFSVDGGTRAAFLTKIAAAVAVLGDGR